MKLVMIVGMTAGVVYLMRPAKSCKARVTAGTDGQTGAPTEEKIIVPPAREMGLANLRHEFVDLSTDTFQYIRHKLHLDACAAERSHPGVDLAQQAVQA